MKNIILTVAAALVGATAVATIKALKAVGATLDDFTTHNDLVKGTYWGSRDTWTVNGEEIIGVYSPVTVAASGALYACANIDAYGHILVVYDNNFRQLSKDEQYAIVCHEAGHAHYKHNGKVRKLENELAADSYAVAVVGKETMISALNKISSKKHGRDKELTTRIKALA
jgi:hypothetical protein